MFEISCKPTHCNSLLVIKQETDYGIIINNCLDVSNGRVEGIGFKSVLILVQYKAKKGNKIKLKIN